ncbi:hypothetical protein ZIOFF_024852 [Zingiber officinale]|uniref:Uncharacterized protein n=1 Tax=Zingiber officinale TaxID=94328 RepID=A0A8J5GT38_ZINOF|nr:hypothetical protein ZIOFF_024852 [Zingiber officinale]
MVSKLRRQESTRRRSKQQNQWSDEAVKRKEPVTVGKKEAAVRLHKVCKFKRSSFGEEEEATCSAILLLACLVCDPSSIWHA